MTDLATLIQDRELSESRLESLRLAYELGASEEVLLKIRDAVKVRRDKTSMILPVHYYLEIKSRGRGWVRKGRGDNVEWGERISSGYLVGPGFWTVGAHDGFSRKAKLEWTVENIQVGDQTWTIAS